MTDDSDPTNRPDEWDLAFWGDFIPWARRPGAFDSEDAELDEKRLRLWVGVLVAILVILFGLVLVGFMLGWTS